MKQIGYSFQVLESEATTEVHVALELLEPLNYDWLQALNKRGEKISFLYIYLLYTHSIPFLLLFGKRG